MLVFSCCHVGTTLVAVTSGIQALGPGASAVAACGLGSCDTRAWLLCPVWKLPGQGVGPLSPTLAGRLSSPTPPGKSGEDSEKTIL